MGIAWRVEDLPDGGLGATVPDGAVLRGTGSVTGGVGKAGVSTAVVPTESARCGRTQVSLMRERPVLVLEEVGPSER